jgi:hypothetical protein
VARACCALGAFSILAGCAGASDFLSKDAEWFQRPTRLFGSDLSVSTAPLSPKKAVTPDELVSADGLCAGMSAVESPDANVVPAAPAPGAAPGATSPGAPSPGGNIGFDSTECDVVRFAGIPNRTEIGAGERNERSVVLTYVGGPRPGVYRFTAGRLTAIERGPAPEPPPPRATKRRG